MIFLASCWRDSASYLPRYVEQVRKLRAESNEPLHLVAVEGDSVDTTWTDLHQSHEFDSILHCEHGGPKYPSVDHPQRWRQLSTVGNVALCAALRQMHPQDRFVFIESDLTWEPATILSLADHLLSVDAVAPMSMCGARFYDIWGHMRDGVRFNAHPPYYRGWTPGTQDMVPIDSAGSCFALSYEALRVAEFSAIDCIRGIGRSLRTRGFTLWIDPTLSVEHPS